MVDSGSWNAFAAPSDGGRPPTPEPEFGPAPPTTQGRTSFGVSAGPISGNWREDSQTSGAPSTPAVATPVAGHHRSRDAAPSPAQAHPPQARAFPSPSHSYLPPAHAAPVPQVSEMSTSSRSSDVDEWFDAANPVRTVSAASVLDRSRRPLPGFPAPGGADHIGDLLDGPGREIRPHRAPKHPTAPAPAAGTSAPPRRNRGVRIAGMALTAAVLLGGTVAGVTYFAGPDKDLTSVLELGVGKNSPQRVVTAPLQGRTAAKFELVSAVTRVTVRSEDLGEDLYRMTTAEDSGFLPNAALTQNDVRLQLTPDGKGDAGTVEVVLSTKVVWTLRFSGAAEEQILNLRTGKVAGIDLTGGAKRAEIQLPAAAGTVPLKATGAVEELAMTSPAGNPVRVKVNGGATTVAAGDKTMRDVPPGSTVTPKDWVTNDRYDVEAAARVNLLSIDTAQ
ncbi:hypothetical protein AB0M36_15965 [Actinoplanes sp. NPDC051346]|uniref:hypothetical protein n=1 Tax=Actinoplanes sp. NPDC051346 TaxID=3155048 RepID=UPI0034336983